MYLHGRPVVYCDINCGMLSMRKVIQRSLALFNRNYFWTNTKILNNKKPTYMYLIRSLSVEMEQCIAPLWAKINKIQSIMKLQLVSDCIFTRKHEGPFVTYIDISILIIIIIYIYINRGYIMGGYVYDFYPCVRMWYLPWVTQRASSRYHIQTNC